MSLGNEYEQEDHHLQSLTETIATKVGDGAKKTESFFSLASIYKVPEELRKLKESSYTPHLIAIGPLHRNDKHLKTPMQYVKMSYTNCLLYRLAEGVMDPELAQQKWSMGLEECVAEMKLSIDDAKKCYAEEVTLDEEMLLVDGCFIIELLYKNYLKNASLEEEGKKKPMHGGDSGNTQASSRTEPPLEVQDSIKSSSKQEMRDPIYDSILVANTVLLDLLLLENQIPFFVLEKLFRLTIDKIPNRPDKETINELVRAYFGNKMMSSGDNSIANGSATTTNCGSPSDCVFWVSGNKTRNPEEQEVLSGSRNYYHILHILHDDHLPRHQTKKPNLSELMPSASNLDYAGVKFVPGTGNDLFSVNFSEPQGPFWWCHRAHFEIPPLQIYDSTEAFLRNLIAFEQCCPGVSQHFTSYAYLMDMLVNSEKDVEKLEKAGVIRNWLGASEDATNVFNKLCKEIILGEFFFADTCNKATEYSNRCWPKNMAHLRRTYFASPWTFIAFCFGFIAFGMSITQFIRSFFK